jgi:hypothetical protein
MQLFSDMGVSMGGVRGFAQNVANYQAIGTMCPWHPDSGTRNGYCLPSGSGHGDECCEDACNLVSQWNPCVNEMIFAQALSKAAQKYLSWSPVNIIDTSRNGVPDARTDYANWCNPRNMGACRTRACCGSQKAAVISRGRFFPTSASPTLPSELSKVCPAQASRSWVVLWLPAKLLVQS